MKQMQLRNTRIQGRAVPKVKQKLVEFRKQKKNFFFFPPEMKVTLKGTQVSQDTTGSTLRNRD